MGLYAYLAKILFLLYQMAVSEMIPKIQLIHRQKWLLLHELHETLINFIYINRFNLYINLNYDFNIILILKKII